VQLRIKKVYYLLILNLAMMMSHPLWARDLESIATSMTSRSNKLIMKIVPIGFAIAAAFMAVGNPRGNQIATGALTASILVLGAGSIFGWLQGVVG
jgi:hypothetical protein